MTPTRSELRRLRRVVALAQRVIAEYPLAAAVLWHAPPPGTSQRAAASLALRPDLDAVGVFGGNRAGKTRLGACLAVAWAMGGAHPAVRLWARANGIDIGAIPPRPGVVCCSALTGNDSIRVQRPAIADLLPAGAVWRNRDGHGEASVSLPDTGHGAGRLIFKSNDQGRRSYQGDAWDFLWLDEEHSRAVYDEARIRLVDRAGRAVLTMTPLLGQTWVWARFIDRPEPRSAAVSLHSADNPHIPRAYLEALLARYSAGQRAARARGDFVALEGAIYPDFNRGVHVVPPFDIPAEWPRFMGMDFGYTNPAAFVWGALDSDGRLYVYREHQRDRWLIGQHAEALLAAECCPSCWSPAGFGTLSAAPLWWEQRAELVAACTACGGTGRREPVPDTRWADPENVENRRALSFGYDVFTEKAPKSVLPGIESVAARLAVQADGRPRLLIFSTCRETIRSVESYRWRPLAPGAKAAPLKINDHAADALRYLVYGLHIQGR